MSRINRYYEYFLEHYLDYTLEHNLHYTLISWTMRLNSNKSAKRNGLLPAETCTKGSITPADVQDAGIEHRRF